MSRFSLIIIVLINVARQSHRKEIAIKTISLRLIVQSVTIFSVLNRDLNFLNS